MLSNAFTNFANAYDLHKEVGSTVICESFKFVTNAYEDRANVAKFERVCNI